MCGFSRHPIGPHTNRVGSVNCCSSDVSIRYKYDRKVCCFDLQVTANLFGAGPTEQEGKRDKMYSNTSKCSTPSNANTLKTECCHPSYSNSSKNWTRKVSRKRGAIHNIKPDTPESPLYQVAFCLKLSDHGKSIPIVSVALLYSPPTARDARHSHD